MGCTSSVPARGEFRTHKRGVGDSPIREGASSQGIGMETTASDHNSVRRSITVWDLQLEKERRARERRRSSVRTPTAHSQYDIDHVTAPSTVKRAATTGWEHTSSYSHNQMRQQRTQRDYMNRVYTPKASQSLIPSWSISQPVLTRSNSISRGTSLSRSSSFVLNSPSSRVRNSPPDDAISNLGGGTPRNSTGSLSNTAFSNVRMGNSYPITSEYMNAPQPLRYGSRRTADNYPSRSTRW
jgi:hypothetical protein